MGLYTVLCARKRRMLARNLSYASKHSPPRADPAKRRLRIHLAGSGHQSTESMLGTLSVFVALCDTITLPGVSGTQDLVPLSASLAQLVEGSPSTPMLVDPAPQPHGHLAPSPLIQDSQAAWATTNARATANPTAPRAASNMTLPPVTKGAARDATHSTAVPPATFTHAPAPHAHINAHPAAAAAALHSSSTHSRVCPTAAGVSTVTAAAQVPTPAAATPIPGQQVHFPNSAAAITQDSLPAQGSVGGINAVSHTNSGQGCARVGGNHGAFVDLEVPAAHEGSAQDLHLLLLVWAGVPDVGALLRKRSGCRLNCDLRTRRVLGLIPSGEAVMAACMSLSCLLQPQQQQQHPDQQHHPDLQRQQQQQHLATAAPQVMTLEAQIAEATYHKVLLGTLGVHSLHTLRLLRTPSGTAPAAGVPAVAGTSQLPSAPSPGPPEQPIPPLLMQQQQQQQQQECPPSQSQKHLHTRASSQGAALSASHSIPTTLQVTAHMLPTTASPPPPPSALAFAHPSASHHVLLPPSQSSAAQPTNGAVSVPVATQGRGGPNNGEDEGGHGRGAAAPAAAGGASVNHILQGISAAPMCIDKVDNQGENGSLIHGQNGNAALCSASLMPAAPAVAATATGRPMRAAAAAAAASKQQQQQAARRQAGLEGGGGSQAQPPGGVARVRSAQAMPLSDRELQLMQCSMASFRYMYGDDGLSFKEEVQGSCCCPFCDLQCKHGLGLQQHLVASHAHFFYCFILPPPLPLPSHQDTVHQSQGHQNHSGIPQHQHHHQQQQQQQHRSIKDGPDKTDGGEASRSTIAHAHPGHPHQLVVLVHVPAAMYSPEGRMLVADADIVLDQEQQPARLLWMFCRRLHPTHLFMLNLVPGSALDQELNYPPSKLTAAPEYSISGPPAWGLAALPIQGAARGRVRGTRPQGSKGKQPSRLALLRRPPYYELDQAHHLEGRWEGFKSLLERKEGWPAFNRGREGDPQVVPLTLRQVDVAEGSTRRRTRGGANGAMNAAAEALALSGNNMYGYGDGSVSQALYGPHFRSPRFYFHTHSTMPMTCEDLETAQDSDDESDQEQWEVRAQRDIVSAKAMTEAERQFMICWNRFGNRRKLFSDYVLPQRCEEFVRECWTELHTLKSSDGSTGSQEASAPAGATGRNALLMHLLCLFEHALVSGATVERCLRIYDGLVWMQG